jgi:hypothetical protein
MWLTEYGVSALITNNITNVQSVQDRGFYINQQILNETDLENAIGFVFENKYFLCVNGHIYVADPRKKFGESLAYAESFQYDWYYWEGFTVNAHAEIGGKLYIGTPDGHIIRLKTSTDEYPYCDEKVATPSLWALDTVYAENALVHDGLENYYRCLKPHTSSTERALTNIFYWQEILKVGSNYQIPVLAYWTTPIMNMGNITMRKTLKNLWVRLGKHPNMSVKIYYSTQGVVSEKYDGIFDFSNIDFSRFTFSTDTDPSVMVTNRQERKFMSIQFKVESRDQNPFSLLEIVGKYTINNVFKG